MSLREFAADAPLCATRDLFPSLSTKVVDQPSYAAEHHATYQRVRAALAPAWRRFASRSHWEGHARLELPLDEVPRLDRVSEHLKAATGWGLAPVSGPASNEVIFTLLQRSRFPVSVAVRDPSRWDFSPEPDIIHDCLGHLAMLASPPVAQLAGALGDVARAVERLPDDDRVAEAWLGLERLMWFTLEVGAVREGGALRAYGAALLSSLTDLEHAMSSPEVERRPFSLDAVLAQPFDDTAPQSTLFVVDGLEEPAHAARELLHRLSAPRR